MRTLHVTAIMFSALAAGATAQTTFAEVEPNTNKGEATTAGVITLVSGDGITGTTTGTTTTALSTLPDSVDCFRVKTGALPLGIYRHQLTITTTGTAGHVVTIRGLAQTAGVPQATSDVTFQPVGVPTTPPRYSVWYGFGKQEEIYYSISGDATTTAPYVATLSTTSLTAVPIAGTFHAGPITVRSALGQTTDTEIYLYDANLNPVPLAHNDDTSPSGSLINPTLAAGTYYVAISNYNTGNDQSDLAPGESFTFGRLLDFPNAIANSNTTIALPVSYLVTDGVTTTSVTATKANPFEIVWGTFNVVGVVPPPANDDCANAIPLPIGTLFGQIGTATHDGSASCDPGGSESRDVWYTFTSSTWGGTLNLDTCTSTGVDTVVSVLSACGGLELACNDDCGGAPCGGSTSCLSVSLAPYQKVRIRVSDKGLGGTTFKVHSSFVGNPLPNDGCTTPVALSGPGIYPFTTITATTGTEGQSEALCAYFGGTAIPRDIWFAYAPTSTGMVAVTTCGLTTPPPGPSTDSKIAIYAGSGCPAAGSAIACNDDAGTGAGSGTTCAASGSSSYIEFPATCGVVDTIQIGMRWSDTSWLEGSFSVTETGGTACATPVTYYCKGDGTGAACPCGNVGAAGNGCANSLNANGGNISASGVASITADTWLLSSSGVANGPGLYFQGTTQLAGGNGVAFGDGLRCTGGSVFRLGVVIATGNASTYPSPNPPAANQIPISIKGFNVAGGVRNYQLWYRDSDPVFCSASTFNLTNAVNMTWAP